MKLNAVRLESQYLEISEECFDWNERWWYLQAKGVIDNYFTISSYLTFCKTFTHVKVQTDRIGFCIKNQQGVKD